MTIAVDDLDWKRADRPDCIERYEASHSDGIGVYVVYRTHTYVVQCRLMDNTTLDGPQVYAGLNVDGAKAAAADHHRASIRANAWARYMRDNDPPA